MINSRRALVTGGAGFLGSHVVAGLIFRGYQVVVLDDLSGGDRAHVHPDAVIVEGSVVDARLVESLFTEYRFTHVFHLAAYAAEGLSPFIRRFNYTTNVVGSATILNACLRHEVQRLIFTSSIAVYGDGTVLKPPFFETDDEAPTDPYGIAKFAVELDIHAAAKSHGLSYTIFRPHNVYGPHQHLGDKYRNVVGIFVRCALEREPMPIFGDGNQVRAFSYVTPVANAIVESAERDDCHNETFNVGADIPVKVRDLAALIADLTHTTYHVEFRAARHEALEATADHRKAVAVFGDTLKDPGLITGLTAMIAWAKAAGIHKSRWSPSVEVQRGLPEGW